MDDDLAKFQVKDKSEFVQFITLLREDFLENKEEWTNKKLSDFLDAVANYAEDIQDHYDNMRMKINAEEPSWQTFADIFKGATVYE